jgi:hypothetical protein
MVTRLWYQRQTMLVELQISHDGLLVHPIWVALFKIKRESDFFVRVEGHYGYRNIYVYGRINVAYIWLAVTSWTVELGKLRLTDRQGNEGLINDGIPAMYLSVFLPFSCQQ